MYHHDHQKYRISTSELRTLFDLLVSDSCQNVGPVYRDGAIMLDRLSHFDQLATGLGEHVGKGEYRLEECPEKSLFHYSTGPQSFKQFLYPPKQKLWSAVKDDGSFQIKKEHPSPQKMVFWGVRDCDIQAIRILDRIFLQSRYPNAYYQEARKDLFIIAAACTSPSANCFCTTMGGHPAPEKDFDLLLTEIPGTQKDRFLLETGSERGEKAISSLGLRSASTQEVRSAGKAIERARVQMKRRFSPAEAADFLKDNPDHPHWENIGSRCLSCANCTLVCPTCFCSDTEDITDLTGSHTERWLRWDSCFNGDYSYIHGGQVRASTKSRYRQWLTHKFSSWITQFGTSGCVGCGRCITWCPAGIDLTEEILALKPKKSAGNEHDDQSGMTGTGRPRLKIPSQSQGHEAKSHPDHSPLTVSQLAVNRQKSASMAKSQRPNAKSQF